MKTLIKKIARYLVSKWDSLYKAKKWAIEQIASSYIIDAIEDGVSSTMDALEDYSSKTLNKIASLLGI